MHQCSGEIPNSRNISLKRLVIVIVACSQKDKPALEVAGRCFVHSQGQIPGLGLGGPGHLVDSMMKLDLLVDAFFYRAILHVFANQRAMRYRVFLGPGPPCEPEGE